MTAPFLTVFVSILYFGWLWHDRSATDCKQSGLSSTPGKPGKPENSETEHSGQDHCLSDCISKRTPSIL
jgi:hypothetical protein